MSWTAFVNWISSWFVHDDKELKQILASQADLRGYLLILLSQGETIMADLATTKADGAKLIADVKTLKTDLSSQIADLKAQIAAGSPVTQADLDDLDATIKAADTDVTTP